MARLKDWFDDYNSYHPHSEFVLHAANAVQGEAIGSSNIPAALDYRVLTRTNAPVTTKLKSLPSGSLTTSEMNNFCSTAITTKRMVSSRLGALRASL